MHKARVITSLLIILVVLCTAVALVMPKKAFATAGTEAQLSFEGKVVNTTGINIPDSTYNMEFKVYSGGTSGGGGTLVWTEDYLVGSGSVGVAFSSGTFQKNLGSVCAFTGGSCETYVNTGVNWNTHPLYLSMQVGNTSVCTVTTTFQANCGGDGEMSPYILLTSTPYSFNSSQLGGLTPAGYVQTALGGQVIQPTTNAIGLSILQNSSGSPSADIFDIQTANTSSVLQISGPSINSSNVVLNAVGAANNVTINPAGTGTLNLGTLASANTIQIGSTALAVGTQTINIGNDNTVGGTTNVVVGAGNVATGGTTTIQANSSLTMQVGNTSEIINTAGDTIKTSSTNSTSALQVQNALGISLLNVDTQNGLVNIGTGVNGDNVGYLLVLDSKNTAADPTEVNGAMYYNASTGNFRCGMAGTWENCIGGLIGSSTPGIIVNTCTVACAAIATGTSFYPQNYCVAGRTIHIIANGVYSDRNTPTLALNLYIGTNPALASDTLLGSAANAAAVGTTQTNLGWSLDAYLYCASTTSMWVQGGTTILTTTAGGVVRSQISSTAATPITNTTQNLYIFPVWGTSNVLNTISATQFIVTGM